MELPWQEMHRHLAHDAFIKRHHIILLSIQGEGQTIVLEGHAHQDFAFVALHFRKPGLEEVNIDRLDFKRRNLKSKRLLEIIDIHRFTRCRFKTEFTRILMQAR